MVGYTQKKVLNYLSDCEWRNIDRICWMTKRTGADQATRALFKRGLVERRLGERSKKMSVFHEYRITEKGIDALLEVSA